MLRWEGISERSSFKSLKNIDKTIAVNISAFVHLTHELIPVPMWLKIIKGKTGEAIRVWRVAHTTLATEGIMMIVVGLLLLHLPLPEFSVWVVVWALVASGYGFVFAMLIGAWKGIRGLTLKPYGLNTFLFCGHVIGAIGSFMGIIIVIYGSFEAF